MRHALLVIAGIIGIGMIWACEIYFSGLLARTFKWRQYVNIIVAYNGIAGLAVIATLIMVECLSVIW